MTNPEPRRGAVLITGASTGIGADCARRLDRMGFTVFAGVRKPADGEALRTKASERLIPLQLDVTSQADIDAAIAVVSEHANGDGLLGLVNNAGVAVAGPQEFLTTEDWRDGFEVNVFGTAAMTKASIPLLRQARGRIVNISSLAGKVAMPFFGPYAASKHAMEAMSDALRLELQPWGMHVAVVEPGSIATPIWKKGVGRARGIRAEMPPEAEERYGETMERMLKGAAKLGEKGGPTKDVSRAIIHALTSKRPRTRYVVGRDARIAISTTRYMPDRLRDRFITKTTKVPRRDSVL